MSPTDSTQSMDSHHLRAILLKLQDRLSDDDRKRFHFFIGNDVPRRIRDDPSLGGTLCLLESLFDQDKINEQDFTFLINAFDEIQCIDAVKLLREYMRKIQSNEVNQSVQSLSLLMPSLGEQLLEDQDDKYFAQSYFMEQTNVYGNVDSTIVSSNNINNLKKSPLRLKHKQLSSTTQKCLIVFILLMVILAGVVMGCCVWINHLISYNTRNGYTQNNGTNQYLNQNQAQDNEILQDIIKKIKYTLVNELRKIKPLCREIPHSTSEVTTPVLIDNSTTVALEGLACLEACYTCVEDYPLTNRKKRTADNCGPMCVCADSCYTMPIEQVKQLCEQSNFTQNDKDCFWKTYTNSLDTSLKLLL